LGRLDGLCHDADDGIPKSLYEITHLATKMQQRHLAIIGAMEEGILTIERFLAEQEQ
jgi:hypothetical protein